MASLRRSLLTNHNRCWIWGRNVVIETLRAGYWPVLELLHSDRCETESRSEAAMLAKRSGISEKFVHDDEITKQCRSSDHQGLAARMPPFPYRDMNEFVTCLSALHEKGGQTPVHSGSTPTLSTTEGGQTPFFMQSPRLSPIPVLAMLDRVQDSYNFGAIIRSADVLGIDGVIVGTREQAQVNSLVARSSAGAVNYVPIAQTDDLAATVEDLKVRGFQIIGTSDRATESIFEPDYRRPTLILIGNEGRGIQPSLQTMCTQVVQIPVLGHVGSLNAAVSAGILFYEVLRQRRHGVCDL